MSWRFWRRDERMTLSEQRQAITDLLAREIPNHPQQTPRYIAGMDKPDARFQSVSGPRFGLAWRNRQGKAS